MDLTVTKWVAIDCSVKDVFRFLADVGNWPRYAVHNVKSARQTAENIWSIETPRGPGRVVLHPDAGYGILDHEFIDAGEGRWEVPHRVVAAGGGSVVIFTFAKPSGMELLAFEQGMNLVDEELAELKRVLESSGKNAVEA
jgi:hypothetical protein